MASKAIAAKKGGLSGLTVLVSYAVAAGAQALAKHLGIDIPDDTQTQVTLAATAGLSALITGVGNWIKHRNKKK